MAEQKISLEPRELISAGEIARRVAELGAELSRDYADKEPILLCVLHGAIPFYADLARAMTIPLHFDSLSVSSYHEERSTGVVTLHSAPRSDLAGEHVLIVEDIVDTGLTLETLLVALGRQNPASLEVITLLDKPSGRQVAIEPRYRGFEVGDEFVVGYGLDYDGLYRNLPWVGVLDPR